ncbi:MAG: acyl-CoA dehydrogenase family protein [Thermodesulfobacteriota bacterium]|nr:acyl-CoA dehydrogenase family protein [Thermodesulfobacteriota bacterium]
MDFKFGEKEENLRKEIREFAKKELPQNWLSVMFEEEHRDEDWEFAMLISKKLSEKGWLTMSWPEEYGGKGASLWEQLAYSEEASYWGIPGTTMGVGGVDWVGPSLMMFGTDELKKKHLPLIASGSPDGVWCTGYSEPNAGSDFASIRTRAVRDGDEYVINGQKIWTSAAHRSRWCWLAVKTDIDAPKKHKGVSVFVVDMKTEGITVRPLLNYVGYHIFNEVFFDDVRVPATNLVGEENRGWYQLMHSLGYERGSVAGRGYGYNRRILDELIMYCRENNIFDEPEIRNNLADLSIEIETQKMLAYETISKMSKGGVPIYEPSRDKVFNDHILEHMAFIGTEILGGYAQIDPLNRKTRWTKLMGCIENLYWLFPGISFAAGTDEVELNIIGQYGLNLPKSY